ncbi:hydrolase [Pontibacillus halophilus JSM 076056 = DSM 19796]|uniref:Hydrolase n=1 Tax=Pontibacillus halophilus JSM 076056 = DSM 19796 TaxID=1385510 RepID=A0A0A5GP58_9BACI|nr:HAD family hydrolase [Pontibacillus halophilus]KGX92993.1 hydrolase [Pontibacillus halophilus JSM 076056 = DSM 19796]
MKLEDYSLVIFDLDGTLYEDTAHFSLFAEKLKHELPLERQHAFERDEKCVQKGEHPLAIGKVYDTLEDIIWTWDPFTDMLIEPLTWDGKEAPIEQKSISFRASDVDFDRWLSIGDGWWPPYVLARHHGVPMETCHKVYNETKVVMSSEGGWMTRTEGLRNTLLSWKEQKHLVLVTNSDKEDVIRILSKLNLDDVFSHIIPSAMKPKETEHHFKSLLETYKLEPHDALSIGDNFINEIAPALKLGMASCWLTPDEPPITHPNLFAVSSLKQVF